MLYVAILYVYIHYEGEGRTALQFFLHPHNNRTVSRHTKLQHTA